LTTALRVRPPWRAPSRCNHIAQLLAVAQAFSRSYPRQRGKVRRQWLPPISSQWSKIQSISADDADGRQMKVLTNNEDFCFRSYLRTSATSADKGFSGFYVASLRRRVRRLETLHCQRLAKALRILTLELLDPSPRRDYSAAKNCLGSSAKAGKFSGVTITGCASGKWLMNSSSPLLDFFRPDLTSMAESRP